MPFRSSSKQASKQKSPVQQKFTLCNSSWVPFPFRIPPKKRSVSLVQHPLPWAVTKWVSVSKEFLDCFIQMGHIKSKAARITLLLVFL